MTNKHEQGPLDREYIFTMTQANITGKNTMVNPNLFLFLDTATHYTGYALFELSTLDPAKAVLAGYGLIKAPGKDVVWDRSLKITAKVSNLIHTLKPGGLVVEYPTFQGGTKGNHAARSGATLQLAYLCGRIAACWEYYVATVYSRNAGNPMMEECAQRMGYAKLLPFAIWNGQRPKHVTCERCEEFLELEPGTIDPKSIDNNWVDAMMMGAWYVRKELHRTAYNDPTSERVDL